MRFALSLCVVHSDQPEIKAMKIRQCSGANRIKHLNAKSLETKHKLGEEFTEYR